MAVKSPQWHLSQGSVSLAHCSRPNIQSDQIRTHVVLIALVMPAFVMWIQHDRGLGLQSSNIGIHPQKRRNRETGERGREGRRRRGTKRPAVAVGK